MARNKNAEKRRRNKAARRRKKSDDKKTAERRREVEARTEFNEGVRHARAIIEKHGLNDVQVVEHYGVPIATKIIGGPRAVAAIRTLRDRAPKRVKPADVTEAALDQIERGSAIEPGLPDVRGKSVLVQGVDRDGVTVCEVVDVPADGSPVQTTKVWKSLGISLDSTGTWNKATIAAELLGVTASTVRRRGKAGKLVTRDADGKTEFFVLDSVVRDSALAVV